MGDRGNIVNITGPEGTDRVVVYTHWDGSSLDRLALDAIQYAEPRWGDAPYALRMALSRWIGPIVSDTGYGVDHDLGDNEHPLLVIDWHQSRVTVEPWPFYCLGEFELRWSAVLESARWITFQQLEGDPDLLRQRWAAVHREMEEANA